MRDSAEKLGRNYTGALTIVLVAWTLFCEHCFFWEGMVCLHLFGEDSWFRGPVVDWGLGLILALQQAQWVGVAPVASESGFHFLICARGAGPPSRRLPPALTIQDVKMLMTPR